MTDFPHDLVPGPVRKISEVLEAAGHRSWLVGGCVRDVLAARLRGEAPAARNDWDLATDARPERVQELFRKVIPTGIQHGTVTVMLGGHGYEVTTLRGETGYTDGRRPDSVYFVSDIEADLARRDFTVNAIAYDVRARQLTDPFGGREDLARSVLRAVGDALERFREDGLRVLRAARFVATLELSLDERTASAIQPSLDSYEKVSAERIHDEWWKCMKARQPSRAFQVMATHGLLRRPAPELLELRERRAPGARESSFDVSLGVLDRLSGSGSDRLMGLFHELGRDTDGTRDPELGSRAADDIARRLKASKEDRTRLAQVTRHWELPLDGSLRGPALRRWLRRVGPELAERLFELRLARCQYDADGNGERGLRTLREQVARELDRDPPLSTRQLAVSGKELMAELGLAPGKHIGELLEALLEECLDEPTLNQRDRLLHRARQLAQAS